MRDMIKTITIYGASSSKIDVRYIKTANELGRLLALNDIECITGGGEYGLMGAVADGALTAGGKVTGIIPQFMIAEGWLYDRLSDFIAVDTMHSRKQLMAQKSDACIALPGGIGTMEELMEMITWKQLGLYNNPIVILNIDGYYDPLLLMLQKSVDEKFMRPEVQGGWIVANSPAEVLKIITEQKHQKPNMRSIAAM